MPAPYAGRAARRKSAPAWMPILALAALLGLGLLLLLGLAGFYAWTLASGRILPGVTTGPVSAGSLSEAELAQVLDAQWNQNQTLLLSDGQHSWKARPVDVGLWVDPQATAARAYQIGRGSNALSDIIWLARFGSLPVQPVVVFNPQAGRSGLERLSTQINQPAHNASLRLESGQWVQVPAQNGFTLNIDATLQKIAAQPEQTLAGGSVPLVTQTVAPRVTDLAPVISSLRAALDRPLNLSAYDPITNETINWSVPRETLASWISVDPQGDSFQLRLDGSHLGAYLDDWKATLGPERTLEAVTVPADLSERWQSGQPVTMLIRHNPTQYTVQAGDTLVKVGMKVGMPYWKIQQANPSIDINHLNAGQVLTIPSKNDMLPLPVVMNKRIVVNISQQRMWTYENGALLKEYVISTGIDRSPTYPGVYQVRTHEKNAYASAWDLWMPNFMGIYEGWPGFMNGIHGLPTLSNGKLLWAGYLGRPISYGCIVMGLQDAEEVYNWAEAGVVVEIQP